jgi:hypothetical protein
MIYSHATTALPEIPDQPISTWSGEWQHECEARFVLAMSKAERGADFNGSTDADGKRKERGIIGPRLAGSRNAERL